MPMLMFVMSPTTAFLLVGRPTMTTMMMPMSKMLGDALNAISHLPITFAESVESVSALCVVGKRGSWRMRGDVVCVSRHNLLQPKIRFATDSTILATRKIRTIDSIYK